MEFYQEKKRCIKNQAVRLKLAELLPGRKKITFLFTRIKFLCTEDTIAQGIIPPTTAKVTAVS